MKQQDDRSRYTKIIESAPVAMLATLDDHDQIVSRPMQTILDDENLEEIWIYSKLKNDVCDQIRRRPEVCVSYADAGHNRYMSVRGHARIVGDRRMMERYWSPLMKAWYPQGLDDPEMVLIAIQPHTAEYWDGPSSRLLAFLGMATAIARGQEYGGAKAGQGSIHFP